MVNDNENTKKIIKSNIKLSTYFFCVILIFIGGFMGYLIGIKTGIEYEIAKQKVEEFLSERFPEKEISAYQFVEIIYNDYSEIKTIGIQPKFNDGTMGDIIINMNMEYTFRKAKNQETPRNMTVGGMMIGGLFSAFFVAEKRKIMTPKNISEENGLNNLHDIEN